MLTLLSFQKDFRNA